MCWGQVDLEPLGAMRAVLVYIDGESDIPFAQVLTSIVRRLTEDRDDQVLNTLGLVPETMLSRPHYK